MEIGHFVWLRTHSARYNLSSSGMIPINPGEVGRLAGEPRDDALGIIGDAYGAGDSGLMLVHGTQEGNFLAVAALRSKVESAAVVVPEYEPIRVLPSFLGLRSLVVGDIFHFPAKSILIISNPNNPTGLFLDGKRLGELEVELERRGSFAVVDSIFVDFIDRSPRLRFHNMVFTTSTSKFYTMEGLKVGWAIGDPEIIKDMSGIADLVSPGPMDVEAKYAAALVGNREAVRARNLNIIEGNRRIMLRIADELRDSVEVEYVGDMPIAFMKPRCGLSGMEVAQELLKRGVMVVPGEYFGVSQGIRVGLGSVNNNIAEAGLAVIKEFIEECASRHL
ncbi:aminotransferase [Thermocladium modestius]|uniref:Aminotransferase n=1 Tax=Thermocladium modestius TaxID=62609 RepID=A0A830GVR0_9CREN|nr:aminotransferase class I/II-fold pyridoxal phosphate-dependent enzyme [Thermocladium modestius]GGP20148.1 aminotransferase [Thermocladium modestius]